MASNQQRRKRNAGSRKEPKRFKWDVEIVGYMLQALSDYKCQMEYRNSDFKCRQS